MAEAMLTELLKTRQKEKRQARKEAAQAIAAAAASERDEVVNLIAEQVSLGPLPTKLRPSGKTADWDEFLAKGENLQYIPPVNFFKHAPLANIWKDFAKVGCIVEAPNPHVLCKRPVYWYAKVIHFAGYYALVEYEGLGLNQNYIGWMSFCSNVPKPIGFCDQKRILLHPPFAVRARELDCFKKGKALHQNSPTVAENHGEFVAKEIAKNQKYRIGELLEVMDREEIQRMRIGRVVAVVGDRMHIHYVVKPKGSTNPGFWYNMKSNNVHPIGWSHTVGHELYGVPADYEFTLLSDDYFIGCPQDVELKAGQLFETRHPARPYLICVAKIIVVLRHGYFVCEVITSKYEKKFPIRFTYHVRSPYILPAGFCDVMKIKLTPTYESEDQEEFSWTQYLMNHGTELVAPLRFLPERPAHSFKPGMKFETACALDPTYIGPSTVRRVRGHLLYLSFDGWPKNLTDPSELWIAAESPNIYPVGYAWMVGHEFNGRVEDPALREHDFPKDE